MIDVSALEGLGLLLSGIGGGVLAVKKWPVWKKNGNGNGNKCLDAQCKTQVTSTAVILNELKIEFTEFKKDIYPKINETAEGMSEIKGYIKGLHDREIKI